MVVLFEAKYIYLILICNDVPVLTSTVWVIAITLSVSDKGTLLDISCRNLHLLFITTLSTPAPTSTEVYASLHISTRVWDPICIFGVCNWAGVNICWVEIIMWTVCTVDGLDIQCKSSPCFTVIRGEANIHIVSFWCEQNVTSWVVTISIDFCKKRNKIWRSSIGFPCVLWVCVRSNTAQLEFFRSFWFSIHTGVSVKNNNLKHIYTNSQYIFFWTKNCSITLILQYSNIWFMGKYIVTHINW